MSFIFCYSSGGNLHSFASGTVDHTDEWEIERDRLLTGQKLGEGQFGLVLEGTLMTGEYMEWMSIECRKPKTKFLQLLMKTIKKNVTSGVEYQVKNYFTDFFYIWYLFNT